MSGCVRRKVHNNSLMWTIISTITERFEHSESMSRCRGLVCNYAVDEIMTESPHVPKTDP